MGRSHLAVVLTGTAPLLFVASFMLVSAYAGPEPFFEYHRSEAISFVGGISALIALWVVWSIALIAAVWSRVFQPWVLSGLLLAAVSIFYLQQGLNGYLDDLEQLMLSFTRRVTASAASR